MKGRLLISVLMLLSAGTILLAGNELILYNGNVVDTENGTVLYNHTVLVREGMIISVEPSRGKMPHGGTDMTGKFIVPGLIDSHTHYGNSCRDAASAQALSEEYLMKGVTTVRDVGSNYLFIKEYNRLRKEGAFHGPDIHYSSIWATGPFQMPSVHSEGADTENTPWSRIFSIKDSTDTALEQAVREAHEIGCTGFKLYINYSGEELARIIPVARKYGMKVWGHSSQITGADALEVACSGMEVMSHAYLVPHHYYPGKHMAQDDIEYVDRVLDKMLENDVVLDMTISLSYRSGTYFASEVARKAYEKGIRFVIGTDLPGCEFHNEADALHKECGIPHKDILRAATVTGAEILGKKGQLGTISKGAEADILILDDNPLFDISALQDINMTIADGVIVYKRPSSKGSMTLYNCNIVDTKAGKIRKGRTIHVRNGIITGISKAARKPSDGDIDMTGKHVMPGMIDSHVHWGNFVQDEELSAALSKDFITAGVTALRDMGSNYLNIRRFNKNVRNGKYPGPKVYHSALWAAGNYFMDPMDSIGWEEEEEPAWSRKFNISRHTDEELEQAVMEAKALGCTGFKMYINYSEEDLRRVVPIMKRHGMKVWAHATQVRGADALETARSGVDAVSHAYMLCNDITSRDTLSQEEKQYLKSVFKALKKNKVTLDATAHISMHEGEMMYCREIIAEAIKAGVEMVTGTDFFGCAMYDEIRQLSGCGMSNAAILKAATYAGAEVLGEAGKLGTIRKGAAADLLILNGNPLEDISVLENIEQTVIDGKTAYER